MAFASRRLASPFVVTMALSGPSLTSPLGCAHEEPIHANPAYVEPRGLDAGMGTPVATAAPVGEPPPSNPPPVTAPIDYGPLTNPPPTHFIPSKNPPPPPPPPPPPAATLNRPPTATWNPPPPGSTNLMELLSPPPAGSQVTIIESSHEQFDRGAAAKALGSVDIAACKRAADPAGDVRVIVVFAESGRVQSASVDTATYAGTATGGCIVTRLRTLQIPAFHGGPVKVGKRYYLK